MNAAVLKGLLALIGAGAFVSVSAALLWTRSGFGSVLQALGIGCFGVMALTHVNPAAVGRHEAREASRRHGGQAGKGARNLGRTGRGPQPEGPPKSLRSAAIRRPDSRRSRIPSGEPLRQVRLRDSRARRIAAIPDH